MLFVKTKDLKKGMRLARPIYNQGGVLLYERNSKLTNQGIEAIRKIGLIGMFILEPAEPVPPMTQADIEFERFQTMEVFSIKDELERILSTKKTAKLQVITADIIRRYGHLEDKVNFIQNLRSKEDYIFKHALNVAILCAMISRRLNLMVDEQLDIVTAAVVHDIGKLTVPISVLERDNLSNNDKMMMDAAEVTGYDVLDIVFSANPQIRRICMQTQKMLADLRMDTDSNVKPVTGSRVMAVAEAFDTMTAMQFEEEPASEVAALKFLLSNERTFAPDIVKALIQSINILAPGVSVELNTGEKALVIAANEYNVLRPMVLGFHDNNIIDLSNRELYDDVEITDIMKTMDNRYVMNMEELKRQGFRVEEPEYVKPPEA